MVKRLLLRYVSILFLLAFHHSTYAQPAWSAIKANATFIVADTSYDAPHIQPLNVGGWEDGLFISRDGLTLYSYYLPFDVFSLLSGFAANPVCFNSQPYLRGPLLNVDTVLNPWGCPNYFQGDVIIATRPNTSAAFSTWQASNLRRAISNEGAPQGIPKNADTLDVFVYVQNRNDVDDLDIQLLRNSPNNPDSTSSTTIVSTSDQEDNPHIERLNDSTLILLFDREREIFYAISNDNGYTWAPEVLITQVINDQAPYDVQPHLWNDGTDWWIYFCADDSGGKRSIYKSKQQISNDWNSWGNKELVIQPDGITGGHGVIFGIGEPSLTMAGDLSFVVIYGDTNSSDTTDVFDSDPWFLPKKKNSVSLNELTKSNTSSFQVYPNPSSKILTIAAPKQSSQLFFIYGSHGQIVKRCTVEGTSTINIQDLPNGTYYIQSQTESSNFARFIKME